MNRFTVLVLLLAAAPLPARDEPYNYMERPVVKSPVPATLDALIPVDLRVRNTHSNCVWAAAETVTVAAGWESFRGITQRAAREGWRGASMENVVRAYKDAGIEYVLQPRGNYSWDIFTAAMKEGVGVYFEIPGHAMACVGVDQSSAYVIDNNGPPVIKAWPISRFQSSWQGGGCFSRHRPGPSCPGPDCPGPNCPNCPHPSLVPEKPLMPPPAPATVPATPPAAANDDVLKAIAALRKEIATIQLTPGPPGKDGVDGKPGSDGKGIVGPTGPAGPAGQNADPAEVGKLNQRVAALEAALKALSSTRTIVVPAKP